ncbi:MAG: hypothetical protein WCT04_22000 [Planctomycetota bacterium]
MPATHCRAAVFHEIQRLVLEYDDTVASHDSNFVWNVDDALSDIIIRLNGEARRVRKLTAIKQAKAA